MPRKQKSSLVENINRRKRAGKSRPKSQSTVSEESYREMQEGWPHAKRRKRSASKRSGSSKTR